MQLQLAGGVVVGKGHSKRVQRTPAAAVRCIGCCIVVIESSICSSCTLLHCCHCSIMTCTKQFAKRHCVVAERSMTSVDMPSASAGRGLQQAGQPRRSGTWLAEYGSHADTRIVDFGP